MRQRGAFLIVLSLLWAAHAQPRDACQEAYASLSERVIGLMRTGEDEHAAMLREVRRLLARYPEGYPRCRSDLLTEELALVNFLDDAPGAIRLATAYLDSPLSHDFPMDRAFAFRVRGYARETLGETVAGAQDYFEAAALARRVPVLDALPPLLDAAETAIALGDLDAADRYHREAERLVRDSLAAVPGMRLRRARLHTARAGLLTLRLEQETRPPRQQRLARALAPLADSAAADLARELSTSHDVTLDLANEALARSARAVAAAVLQDAPTARRELQSAEARLAASGEASRDAAHTVWMRASRVQAALGDTAAAERAAVRARDEARHSGVLAHEAMALERLAMLAEGQQRWADAEARYRDALALREVERERLELQDWSVSAFAASQTPYRGLARLLARRGDAAQALQILDQSRARHLRELREQVRLRERLSPAARLRVDSLLTALEEVRLTQFRHPRADAEARATARLSRLQAALRREIGGAPVVPRLPLRALQDTLRAQRRVLVSYFLGDAESYAFVVTPQSVVSRRLGVTAASVEEAIAGIGGPFRDQIDPAVRLGPLHALYRVLIGPVASLLPPDHGLVVVPDGPLADLPFGMLVTRPATAYASAPYVLRDRPVATELAAAMLLEPTDDAPLPVDLAAFGRSRFERPAGAARDAPLTDLPYVGDELDGIGSHVRRKWVALDEQATEAALHASLSTARIVHVASHARADAAFPMHSEIHLWPAEGDDGVLHLYELKGQRLPADLVVLSGCSTADGQAQRGEGTLGLHYGLRAAGAEATLATLWPIDDRAMADVMEGFYDALAAGLPKDRALQRAQLAYLDTHDGLEASPFYWAPLVLTGHTGPVPMDPPRAPWPWLLGGAALAGLAWSLARRRHARRPAAAL